ncbi:hypothetical protein, partial [Desulfobacula sp.]
FNKTIMELKLLSAPLYNHQYAPFNQTIMELKPDFFAWFTMHFVRKRKAKYCALLVTRLQISGGRI